MVFRYSKRARTFFTKYVPSRSFGGHVTWNSAVPDPNVWCCILLFLCTLGMHYCSQHTEPSSSLRNSLSLTLKSDRRLGLRTPRLPAEPISRWGQLFSLERASQPFHTVNVVYIPGVCSTHEQFQLCEEEAAVCSQGSHKRVPRFANVQYNIRI